MAETKGSRMNKQKYSSVSSRRLAAIISILVLMMHAAVMANPVVNGNFESGSNRVQTAGAAGITLAENGKSDYVVVLGAKPTPAEKFAVETMSKYLKQVTGAEFPIVGEDTTAVRTIAIGNTRFAEASDIAGLGMEEWVQRTAGDRLVIAGGTARATAYGVFDFLERYAGVYQLAPDTEVVPRRADLRIPALNQRCKPAFISRCIYDPSATRGAQAPSSENMLYLIWNMDNARVGTSEQLQEFRLRVLPGAVHTFGKTFITVKEFAATHPEYFSMDANGQRMTDDKGAPGLWTQLCASNPEVRKIVLEKALRLIADDRVSSSAGGIPASHIIEISQNDNTRNLCLCPPCKVISEREGSESGLLIDFINEVARGIAKEYPDMLIQTFAYNYTLQPPLHIRPEPNVLVKWCDNYGQSEFFRPLTDPVNAHMRRSLEGWSTITRQLAVWDYWRRIQLHAPGFYAPQINVHCLQPELAYLRDQNVVSFVTQSEGYFTSRDHPYADDYNSFTVLKNWLGYKMLQNPDRPVEPLLDTFFSGYYGAAAEPMRELLHYMERRQSEAKEPIQHIPRHSLADLWLDAAFFAETERLLNAAEAAVVDDSRSLLHVKYERIPVDSAFLWLEGVVRRKATDPAVLKGINRSVVLKRFQGNWQSYLENNLLPASVEKCKVLMESRQRLIESMSPSQLDPFARVPHVESAGWKLDGVADESFWTNAAVLGWLPREVEETECNAMPVRIVRTDKSLLISCGRTNEPTSGTARSQVRFYFGLTGQESGENILQDGTKLKGSGPVVSVTILSNGKATDWVTNVPSGAPEAVSKWKSGAVAAVQNHANSWHAEVEIPLTSITACEGKSQIAFNVTSSPASGDKKMEVWSPWMRGKHAPLHWSTFFGTLELCSSSQD